MSVPDLVRLRNSLTVLNEQLDDLPSSDAAAVARLRATLADIESALAPETPGAGVPSAGLGVRLTAAARDFEDSHPGLTGALGSVIDALGRMGI